MVSQLLSSLAVSPSYLLLVICRYSHSVIEGGGVPRYDVCVIMGKEDDARINKGSFPPKDGPLNHEVYCFELGSPGILSATP